MLALFATVAGNEITQGPALMDPVELIARYRRFLFVGQVHDRFTSVPQLVAVANYCDTEQYDYTAGMGRTFLMNAVDVLISEDQEEQEGTLQPFPPYSGGGSGTGINGGGGGGGGGGGSGKISSGGGHGSSTKRKRGTAAVEVVVRQGEDEKNPPEKTKKQKQEKQEKQKKQKKKKKKK